MGACFHSAYNLEQVKDVEDFDYIISGDLEFYKQMLESMKSDRLETDNAKKEKKVKFVELVNKELKILIDKVQKYDKKKQTEEKVKTLKDNYQSALNSINLLDEDVFMKYINNMIEILVE